AQKFTKEVVDKFKKIIKSVIIFGSTSRGDLNKDSDIDLLVIYDDTAARFTPEMKEAFDNKLQEIGKSISKKISVQPAWSLTEFWDMARIGHPLLYTIVRDGWALYDDGFFIPVRKLLEAGKIPHTIEAIELLMGSAPKKIERVKNVKLYMIAEDLYYAMLNSSQAVLMFLGKESPTPKNVVKDVKEYLVDARLLPKKYLKWLEQVIKFRKDVEHKKLKKISGQKLDKFIEKAEEYVKRMNALLMAIERRKKEDMIKKNYEVMLKGTIATLKSLGKLPENPKDLPKAIKKYLIGHDNISPMYENVFRKIITMRKMIDTDEIDKIPQRDIEMMREYVRRFIRELSKLVEEKKVRK
ncbi:MAG: nucleotidyltransferase domain-containing protein, partial [Candidatus Aenigmarchaeota archaeon]|nr:nucleotidyltransferase domain-containing protein [Candidatus Aenigmarchaeota archaeon]